MGQPYNRVYNFSAGPCTLPVQVLEQAREGILNYNGTGMSVMEMSHRSGPYEQIIQSAEADLRTLMGIPDGFRVLFLGGGASLQFSMVAINFLRGASADYIQTGTWGQKAVEAARIEGQVNLIFDGKPDNFCKLPAAGSLQFDAKAVYTHFTSNETIQGVEFSTEPAGPTPLFCDMSSDILSRPVDVAKYAMIYAGAQKNMGPAGVTVAIIRDDMVDRVPKGLHPMLDYRLQAENGSMYNTPPCWNIYICGLVYKYLLAHGGLNGAAARNKEKAKTLYDVIDSSNGFFKGHAAPEARSNMNVTFTLPSEELTKEFLKLTEAAQLDGLKGHRSVGGCRASIYNAFPLEGCQALAAAMQEFAAAKG